MEIDRIILHLCKRIKKGGHSHIDYTPRKKLQSILGSNGSGKTSLMLELSPQPSNPDYYERGGYKKIYINSNTSKYELTSDFTTNANKYWFVKDNVELNPGGTVTAYKALVEREFGITADIHRIQIGLKTFSKMTVNERRSIFTMFADMGYEYAFGYYRRLKDQLREVQASIKHQQNRLVEESKKFLSPEEESKLRSEVSFLKQFLNDCLELKHPVVKSHTQIEDEAKRLEQLLYQLQNALVKQRKVFINKEGYTCSSEIENELANLQIKLGKIHGVMETIHHDVDNANKTVSVLKKENLTSLKDLDDQLRFIDEEVLSLISRISLHIESKDPIAIKLSIQNCSSQLYEIVSTLPENENRNLSRENLFSLEASLDVLKNNQRKYASDLASMKIHLSHMDELKKAPVTICPRCEYQWKNGFHEKDYESVVLSITNCDYLNDNNEKKLKETLEKIDEQRNYLNTINLFKQLTKSHPALNAFWTYVLHIGVLYTNPKKISSLLNQYEHDIDLKLSTNNLQKRREELLEIKRKTEITETSNVGSWELRIQNQNDRLYDLQKKASKLKTEINTLNTYRQAVAKIEKINQDIRRSIAEHKTLGDTYLDAYKQAHLNELIQATKVDLVEREQAINRTENQRSIILNIEHQVTELKKKQRLLALAEKELSPSEGLIAKNITGFINQFIGQLNAFIENVWTTPIYLVPIQLKDENSLELDYRFQVQILDQAPIADVNDLSKGECEIIDLAFKIVVMQYLKLPRLPLYLDELGANFDKAHRSSVSSLIQTLATYDNFSQVFVVSHFSEVYGSFQEADTVILCSANIDAFPNGKFNEVVSFEEETV